MVITKIELQNLKNYKIVLPQGASEGLRFAAETLSKYLNKGTGLNLSVVESAYPVSADSFNLGFACEQKGEDSSGNDGFRIYTHGSAVSFCADTDLGIIYAVVDYLERFLSVRFFTADCVCVPDMGFVSVPDFFAFKPIFPLRAYAVGDTYKKNSTPEHIAYTKTRDVFTEIDIKHGGPVPVYGRENVHNYRHYVPFEKYGASHPEFYTKINVNGEDILTIDITNGLDENGEIDHNVDVSVVKVVVEEMKKDVLAYPYVETFVLTQEDGPNYYTNDKITDLEKKYKRSGLMVRFCNAVVRELNRWASKTLNKTVKIMTFAYEYTEEAPVVEKDGKICPIDQTVVADENLIIQLALFSNGYHSYFSDRQNPKILKIMREWRVVCSTFWFWGYDIDFSDYLSFYHSFNCIEENVKGFIEYGISNMFMLGTYDEVNVWQCNLRAYVYHRLLWDSSLSAKELIQEFVQAYFGPAADSVNTFIAYCCNHYDGYINEGSDLVFGTFGTHNLPEYNPLSFVKRCEEILSHGEAEIAKMSDSDEKKATYYKHFCSVMATPLNLLYINFFDYYPKATLKDRDAVRERFAYYVRNAGIKKLRENFDLQKYIAHVESEEFRPGRKKKQV